MLKRVNSSELFKKEQRFKWSYRLKFLFFFSTVCLGWVIYWWSGVPFELYCKQMEVCVVSEHGQSPDDCRNARTIRDRKKPREHQLLVLGLETSAHSKQYSHNRDKTSRSKKKKTSGVLDGILLTRYKVSCLGSRHNRSLGRVTNYKPSLMVQWNH